MGFEENRARNQLEPAMKVACVHYHFQPGGVTRVVENAAAGLAEHEVDLLTLSADAILHNDALPTHQQVPELSYRYKTREDNGATLADALESAARSHFGTLPDLWHFHNHSLGKQVDLPAALHRLLNNGARVLLQIHDFSEDARPENYARQRAVYADSDLFAQHLYPAAPQVHYALLNGRDRSILAAAGVPEERLHLLPNAISVPSSSADGGSLFPHIKKLLLYPTRGIRRKNIGEVLLLAALAKQAAPGTHFATTLRPKNPEWQKIHQNWEAFANQQDLPVSFGSGEIYPFSALIDRADAVLTTSIAEGFGLGFLEPFLAKKSVVGRDIPTITADFKLAGIELGQLYDRLPIPAKAVDPCSLRSKVQTALTRSYQAYQKSLPPDAVERALASMETNAHYDFGRLDEALQVSAIHHALSHPENFPSIDALLVPADEPTLLTNATRIAECFNRKAYGKQLIGIYHALIKAAPDNLAAHQADAVLNAFLDPSTLSLLRT